ncbi:MAG TPA: 3-hydroxyacyl-CoA dehydrogenase NAD-binding domain-containing protein [Stellaceae bacterium]|nr:3-hydroxyacyl-CoA dehydrogenase NAD-binding domain-containing protein [Stellaceae bacterium]
MAVKHAAVIGAGTIGASWAAYFLSRGLSVVASDPAPTGEAFIRDYVRTAWPALERLGLAPGASAERLRFERDPAAAVVGAEFVQESAPEREDMKVELFERLDRALPPEVILASSSSGILISNIAARCRHPERCIIGHPFNPPHMIPLVEVVGGKRTSPAVIERALAFYREIGKRPIHIRKEVRGHLVNRLQAALWREAIHLVADGVASVADVDAGIAYGPGLRWAIMGPHLTFHLAGGVGGMTHFMPHLGVPLARDWWPALGNPELTPAVQQQIIDGVAEEAAGRTIPELAAERDRCLIAILDALKTARGEK